MTPRIVDFHAHVAPIEFIEWLDREADQLGVSVEWDRRARHFRIGTGRILELREELTSLEALVAAQKSAGVTCSVISPVPTFFLYGSDPSVTALVARRCNDSIASWCRRAPERVIGLGTVPLNDGVLAAEELRRVVRIGLRGVIIGTRCSGHEVSEDIFAPFWSAADELKCIVFIHPVSDQAEMRLGLERLPNIIQVPWETTVALVHLLVNGIVYRYPSVRILVAHGGGYLPYQIGRFDRAYAMWETIRKLLPEEPSLALRRMWFDTVLWRKDALQYLISVVGASRVVPGSDFPFDLSVWPPLSEGAEGAESLLEIE